MSWLVTGARIVNNKLRNRQIPMVLEYQVEASQTISLGLVEEGTYNLIVDWGDGSDYDTVTSWDDVNASHTYTVGGTYFVRIWGSATHWNNTNQSQDTRGALLTVKSIGNLGWSNLAHAFYNSSNLSFIAGGRLNGVTTIESMARNCQKLQRVDSAGWFLPNCENITDAFRNCDMMVNRFPNPYYKTISIPTGDPISEMVRVRLTDIDDVTLIDTLIWNKFDSETVTLKPEDYLVNNGLGSNGLPSGIISVYCSLLDSATVTFGSEILLETFEVPEYPKPIELMCEIDTANNALFIISPEDDNIAQSYKVEISDGTYTPIMSIDRPLSRLTAQWPWVIHPRARGSLPLMLPAGTYNYRVAALNREYNDPATEWGDYNEFTIDSTPVFNLSEVPVLSDNLANDIIIYPNYTSGTCRVNLCWDIKGGASTYRVTLSNLDGIVIISNELTSDTFWEIDLPPSVNGYNWAIRGRNATGIQTGWSEQRNFYIYPGIDTLVYNIIGGTPQVKSIEFVSVGIRPVYIEVEVAISTTYPEGVVVIDELDPTTPWVPSGDQAIPGSGYWFRSRAKTGTGGSVLNSWSSWVYYSIAAL